MSNMQMRSSDRVRLQISLLGPRRAGPTSMPKPEIANAAWPALAGWMGHAMSSPSPVTSSLIPASSVSWPDTPLVGADELASAHPRHLAERSSPEALGEAQVAHRFPLELLRQECGPLGVEVTSPPRIVTSGVAAMSASVAGAGSSSRLLSILAWGHPSASPMPSVSGVATGHPARRHLHGRATAQESVAEDIWKEPNFKKVSV